MNSIKKLPQTIIYAARINDRDVLRSSSSGGLFTVLSDPFLRCGGAIVCSVYQCLTYGTYQTIVKYYGEKRQNLLMRIVRKIKKLVVWRQ